MKNNDINKKKIELTEIMLAEKQKLAYELFLRSNGIRENMTIGANCLDINLKTFLIYVRDYIKNNIQTEFANVFDTLEQLNTNDEIITYLNSVNLPLNYLESNLLNYIANFRPDVFFKGNNLLTNLRKKLSIYEKYLKNQTITEKYYNQVFNDNVTNIIIDFINSNYSLERYCFMNRITKTTFKQFISKIKQVNPSLYNEYLKNNDKKEKIKNIEISKDVMNILSLIKELNVDFMAYHLFSNTNYGILELVKCADNILNYEDAKLFRMHVKQYVEIKMFREKTIEDIFNETYIFNIDGELVEITNEIKTEVINFLKYNNTPISMEIFKETCIKIHRERKKHR